MAEDPLSVINLSDYTLSANETQLLWKGLTFCPDSGVDTFEIIKDLQLFARKLILQSLYAKLNQSNQSTAWVKKDLDDLISLLEDQENRDLIDQVEIKALLNEQVMTDII